MRRWFARAAVLAIGLVLIFPALALAAAPGPALLASPQLWVLVIGSLVALLGYVINHYAPWISEPVKAIVHVVLAAGAAAAYSAIATSQFGWNTATAQLIVSGVLAALVAHKILWLPSGISALFGGGSNAASAKTRVVAHTARKR